MIFSFCSDFVKLNSDESSSSFSPSRCCFLIWASGELLRQQLRLCLPWTGNQSPSHWRPSTEVADEPDEEAVLTLKQGVGWPPLGSARHEGCCPNRLGNGRQTHPEQKGCDQQIVVLGLDRQSWWHRDDALLMIIATVDNSWWWWWGWWWWWWLWWQWQQQQTISEVDNDFGQDDQWSRGSAVSSFFSYNAVDNDEIAYSNNDNNEVTPE